MDTGQALLQAILDDPKEDTPRLVYADWLDEHEEQVECGACRGRTFAFQPNGETCPTCSGTGRVSNGFAARAEFIRVQVELARLGPPHKRTRYPEQPTALKKYGDKHYEFIGYVDEGFQVGDRIDVLVHRPLRTPKMVHGFRVYKIEPYQDEYASNELHIYVRLDAESKPWPGDALLRRERELRSAMNEGSLPGGPCAAAD